MPQIHITVIDAQNMKDTEIIGRQDPYVEIRTNSEIKRTTTKYEAGKNARIFISKRLLQIDWGESFVLSCRDLYGVIDFRMYVVVEFL